MATPANLDWQFLNNQIGNSLENSYGDTNIFATDHLSKLRNLAGDVDIDRLIARTETAYAAFQASYTTWQKSTAYWKGATNRTDAMIDSLLSAKLPRWDILIQVSYAQDSYEYITLFPNGRTAFRDAGKDGKIQLLNTFVSIIADYPSLAPIKTDAAAFYGTIAAARDQQQQREQNVRDSSTQLREAQAEMFIILYQNLGALMDKYGRKTEEILNFFDVSMIRNTNRAKNIDETAKIVAIEDTNIDTTPGV